MNDFFEKIGKTITETGKEVSKKTKQVGDIAKYNAKIVSAESAVLCNYKKLGKYYYDNFKDAPADEMLEIVNSITVSLDSIAEMKEMLFSIRGIVKCQNCGSEESIEHDYCSKCGTKLEKPEPVVEETFEEDVFEESFDEDVIIEEAEVKEEAEISEEVIEVESVDNSAE